jgi:hypothetical protein
LGVRLALSFTLTLSTTILPLLDPPAGDPCLDRLLRRSGIILPPDEAADVARGDAVSRVLATADDREIVLFGVVRIDAPFETLLAHLSRPQSHLKLEFVIRYGTFGASPRIEDLRTYELPRSDRTALTRCDRGDCDVKLPLDVIRRFQQFDWTAASAHDDATRATHDWLADYAHRYVRLGTEALVVYDDRATTQRLAAGFRRLVETSPLLHDGLVDFREHLLGYPHESVARTTDALFWSVEDFGLRPLTSIIHTAVHRHVRGTPDAVIALKSIYASHYLHAALRTVALVTAQTANGRPVTYVAYTEQFLFDNDLPGVARPIVRRRMIGHLEDQLERWRDAFGMPTDDAGPLTAPTSSDPSPQSGRRCRVPPSPNDP